MAMKNRRNRACRFSAQAARQIRSSRRINVDVLHDGRIA
jgi:hypothetical protein